ncbi:hypothetical protein QBC43DRAFT_351961 [Cladorrhinum sp. PSN259]|nr:hypothetical protein QBC43DRAFT_351961 [Cladorrhinum sp. PSN259]
MELPRHEEFDRVFDPEGDLILRVGGAGGSYSDQPAHYRVCSATLRRTRIIPSSKPQTVSESVLNSVRLGSDRVTFCSLPENYKIGMEVVLAILHGNFDSLPKRPSTFVLYAIVTTAEKYELNHLIRPWAKDWFLSSVVPRWITTSEERFQKIYLAWQLGSEAVFVSEALVLVLQSAVNKRGWLAHQFPDTQRSIRLKDFDFGFPGFSAEIRYIRDSLFDRMLSTYHDHLQECGTSLGPSGDLEHRYRTTTEIPHPLPKTANDLPNESVSSLLKSIQGGPMRLAFPCVPGHEGCVTDQRFGLMEKKVRGEGERMLRIALLAGNYGEEMKKRREYFGV